MTTSLHLFNADQELDEGRYRRISALARSFLFSRAYTIFVVILIVLNLSLFIWEVATVAGFALPSHWLFFVLEVFANVALLLDVIIRILAAASVRIYLKDPSNWFDLVVLACSLVALLLLFSGAGFIKTLAKEATLVLLAIRYIIVLLRIVLLVKSQGKTLATSWTERVELVAASVESNSAEELSLRPMGASLTSASGDQEVDEDDQEEIDEDYF